MSVLRGIVKFLVAGGLALAFILVGLPACIFVMAGVCYFVAGPDASYYGVCLGFALWVLIFALLYAHSARSDHRRQQAELQARLHADMTRWKRLQGERPASPHGD